MKYKDFKKLSQNDMKHIVGGNEQEDPPTCVTECPICGSGYYCDDTMCGMIIKKSCIKKAE